MTSEDEWYKAAYYKGGGTNAGYWDYPTQSNTAPSNVGRWLHDPGNNANYYDQRLYRIGSPYYRTNVGEFENSASAYGTFDQGGNVWEWNEGIMEDRSSVEMVLRGGCYVNPADALRASQRGNANPPDSNSGLVDSVFPQSCARAFLPHPSPLSDWARWEPLRVEVGREPLWESLRASQGLP